MGKRSRRRGEPNDVPEGAEPRTQMVRYRTVGDATSTGAVASTATDFEAVIEETAVSRILVKDGAAAGVLERLVEVSKSAAA